MSVFSKHHPVLNNMTTRKYGGTRAKIAADPYISGYHFIWFRDIPKKLVRDDSNIKKILSGSCLNVTIPGGTINRTEIPAMGGLKWSVPTSIDYGNTVTLKFLEFSGLVIHKFIHKWAKLIRDYRTGASGLKGRYSKPNYAGSMYYWTTRPDARFKDEDDIEYAAFYTGMFPLKDPHDSFSADLATNDKVEIDIDFNVDWMYHEKWVKEDITELYSKYFKRTFGKAKKNPEGRGGSDDDVDDDDILDTLVDNLKIF